MTPELFREIGEALHGPDWRTPLAYDLNVARLNVRRWASGEKAIPPGVVADLRRLLQEALAVRQHALAALDAAAEEVSDGL